MVNIDWEALGRSISTYTRSTTRQVLEWGALVMIHCAFLPLTIAFMNGVTDIMPHFEVVLFVWGGLLVYFFKSFMDNNKFMMLTNGIGFFMQACLLAMVLYR